ncbi:MAG: T9SS type A sorting domain-containing protein [Chitinophagaceae bacterium]
MKTKMLPFWAGMLLLISNMLQAQPIRNYSLIFSENLKGGHTLIGNTLMARSAEAMNSFSINNSNGVVSNYGNDNADMKMVNAASSHIFINKNESWNYHNKNNRPANWPNVSSLANTKNAPLYHTIFSGHNIEKLTTHYFVKQVTINNPGAFAAYKLDIDYMGGFIIYVNGKEQARFNVKGTNPGYEVTASEFELGAKTFTIPASAFTTGTNTIQVEMKRFSDELFSIKFDLKLYSEQSLANASSAQLSLPAGTNKIKYARLYWGGRVSKNDNDNKDANLKKVKIKYDNGVFGNITATSLDKKTDNDNVFYQSYADITSFVNTHKSGLYTVGDVVATEGSFSGGGAYAGWSMLVVYENETMPYHSVRVYDGFIEVYDDGSPAVQTVTLQNLDVPGNTLSSSDAWMSTMAWEGDGNLGADEKNSLGDFLKINGNYYSDAVNHVKNLWNGTISKNGKHVTSKFPNYKNQMGIDIDEFEIGSGYNIKPNDKSLTITFGTEADQYFPSIAAFSIRMKDPALSIDMTVQDLNGGKLQVNDEMMYTVSGKNTGAGTAYNVIITDELPEEVEFIPNTLEEWNGNSWVTATNAYYNKSKNTGVYHIGTGATLSKGGTLATGASYKVRFKVKVKASGTIINIAAITGDNGAGARLTDEATAIIGFDETILSIKLGSFKAEKKRDDILLYWQTLTETNNDRFEIERSTDGFTFIKIGTVKGKGTTTVAQNYQFTDALAGVSAKTVYYRLKDIDHNNKATYSKVVSLRLDGITGINPIAVYPNPFVSQINFSLQSSSNQKINVKLLNASAQVVATQQVLLHTGSNQVTLNNLQSLHAGIYILQIENNGQTIMQKIIKR